MKKLLFFSISLLSALSTLSTLQALTLRDPEVEMPEPAILVEEEFVAARPMRQASSMGGEMGVGAPAFDSGKITMATTGLMCGGVTLIPDVNSRVRVMSQRFATGLFGKSMKPGKQLSSWVELPAGGLRVGYDWAGPRKSYHYKIFCQRMNDRGEWMPVDCAKVVDLYDVQHNRPCLIGPAGPSAKYAPLNMSIRKKTR